MNPIYQDRMKNYISSYPNRDVMVPVHGRTDQFGTNAYFQCIVAPIEFAEIDMNVDCTNVWGANSLKPGFTQYGNSCNDAVYSRYNNDNGIEPLIIVRDFYGLGVANQIEVAEEFRLLNNIYFNASKNEYIDLRTETVVVKVENNDFVSINKRYLKRYLSVKSSVLLVHISSTFDAPAIDEAIKAESNSFNAKDKIETFWIDINLGKQFSIIYSKILISGVPIDDCGYWPYKETNRQYESFIIDIDKNGKNITYTSNPSELSSIFDSQPKSPRYLTPVFFRREVLQKYYDNPKRYRIGDGALSCGELWSLYIDNQHDDYVSVYLGDLGRDLPDYQEQQHWKNYNIAIDGSISNTKFKRDFEVIAAQPESPIFIFRNKYYDLNEKFIQKFGWPLFLELHDDDEYNFSTLRLPLNNSHTEFDRLVSALVKILIDSLNEKQIKVKISDDTIGSISRLEKWITDINIADYQPHVSFLRDLQKLRSSATAHKKGEGYTKIMGKLQISNEDLKAGFKILIIRATEFLTFVENNLYLLK